MGEIKSDFSNAVKECSGDENINSESILCGKWEYIPHTVLLQIFKYLCPRDLLNAGLSCSSWLSVCYDDYLWKDFVFKRFNLNRGCKISPGKHSWWEEYKRLSYHIPIVETEVLVDHTNQVIHVSFAHNGKLFATCSENGLVLVWDSEYPAKLKYRKSMKLFSWKFVQFSQFNESDTLLLVSGVHSVLPYTTSGEIAVFSLQDGFNLQCRVVNKPYDVIGTWYSDHYLLSGNFFTLGSHVSASVLLLCKASQETQSEHVPVISELIKFRNVNHNAIHYIMVANLLPLDEKNEEQLITSNDLSFLKDVNTSSNSVDDFNDFENSFLEKSFTRQENLKDGSECLSSIYDNQDKRKDGTEFQAEYLNSSDTNTTEDDSNDPSVKSETSDIDYDFNDTYDLSETNVEKLLIFTTGTKGCLSHQIGFKRVKPGIFPGKMNPGPSLAERIAERKKRNSKQPQSDPEPVDPINESEYFVDPDHLIDLHQHIIGMSLSPDHRYLYVNSRSWPEGCLIVSPMLQSPIAQKIDIHVIDLVTLEKVHMMFRANLGFIPNIECFPIFLNVSDDYIACGAENRHGYLWDRHYGISLAKYPHNNIVNAVAFNPKDPEVLITVSDDFKIKIWRSKHRVKQLNIKNWESLPTGLELNFGKFKS